MRIYLSFRHENGDATGPAPDPGASDTGLGPDGVAEVAGSAAAAG